MSRGFINADWLAGEALRMLRDARDPAPGVKVTAGDGTLYGTIVSCVWTGEKPPDDHWRRINMSMDRYLSVTQMSTEEASALLREWLGLTRNAWFDCRGARRSKEDSSARCDYCGLKAVGDAVRCDGCGAPR